MVLILIPINLTSLFFLDQPMGSWIAALAVFGMAFNAFPLLRDRGFSKMMALPHAVLWIPLVMLVAWMLLLGRFPLGAEFLVFLVLLLVIDVISLAFDIPGAIAWLRGDRDAA